ncbi:MAG: carbohydrate binding family 9 domain-containing protein [Vicinamibacteria bacterium]|nr:carbohydrate binding family 9 domain-containing protein [Vicinamibacteria bacterium]
MPRLVVWLLAASCCAAAAAEDAATAPRAAVARVDRRLHLDGVLDEPEWTLATPIGPLIQAEPKQGAGASERTEVRLLADADRLYVAFRCFDRDPKGIISTQLGRDAELDVDDRVVLVLDTFLDRRNGYFFEVNPAGARVDGQVANNGEDRDSAWDGIWDARTRVDDAGWTAELEIPFKTLRFKPGQAAWGLNVERQIKRLRELDRWAAPRLDAWVSNLAAAGELTGLAEARQGRGLELRPYVAGGEDTGDLEGKAGLDVVQGLGPNLTASLTINTDFAETEADDRQINLTRFPLFRPEKRAFFLEGAGIYDVAGLGTSDEDLIPFFSRRIGLLEGLDREARILAGGKVAGRMGAYNVGLLDVQTRDVDELGLAGQNLLAARVSRNVLTQSSIGAIVTHGDPSGTRENTLVGVDARFATSSFRGGQNLSLDLFLMRTDDGGTSDLSFGGRLDYPNDRWQAAAEFKQIGEDFRAALGFVPRTGVRKLSAYTAFGPRPDRLGIRQLHFEVGPEVTTDLQGDVLDWEVFVAPLRLETHAGDELSLQWVPTAEQLDEPFEIFDGIVVPAGEHRWTRYEVEIETASRRRWVAEVEYGWGGFYDGGTLREVQASLTLKPSTHVSLAVAGEFADASLPAGDFSTRILSGRLDYNASPNVSLSTLVQYDNESHLLGVQSRFRWTLRPGNDLHLVFNRGWERREDGALLPSFDRGSAKLQYTIRL